MHEAIAAHDLSSGLAHMEPELAGDIVFGARSLLMLEARFAGAIAGRRTVALCRCGRSQLRAFCDGSQRR